MAGLPFLNHRKMASVIMSRKAEGGVVAEHEEGEEAPELMAAADDLLSGIAMKDAKRVAEALSAAFEILDSMPHVEGEHMEEDVE